MDEDDDFFDTRSLTSAASVNRKKSNNHNYFSVSSNTLYHSVADFDMEMDNLDSSTVGEANHVNQVSANPMTITYSQWRDRVYQSDHFFQLAHSLEFSKSETLCMVLSFTLCQHCFVGEGIKKPVGFTKTILQFFVSFGLLPSYIFSFCESNWNVKWITRLETL